VVPVTGSVGRFRELARAGEDSMGARGSADYQPFDELPDLSGLPALLGC
jgi:hypothetical protein